MLKHSELNELPVVESCEGCGACCMQTAVPPYVMIDGEHEAVLKKVPDELISEIMPAWERRFEYPEQSCMWFDEEKKACRHYDHRPQACRDFELNSSFCHSVRDRWSIGN